MLLVAGLQWMLTTLAPSCQRFLQTAENYQLGFQSGIQLEVSVRATVNGPTARPKTKRLRSIGQNHHTIFRHILKSFVTQIAIPGLLPDPDRVWNMEETSLNIWFEKRPKSFTTSSCHYGGSNAVPKRGYGKQVTTVVAASASGLVAPPFLVVASKKWWVHGSSLSTITEATIQVESSTRTMRNGFLVTLLLLAQKIVQCKNSMHIFVEHLGRLVSTAVPSVA